MIRKSKHLTPRQKEVLDFISFFIAKHGYSPAYKDIASFLKTDNLSTAQYFIEQLEKRGHIKRVLNGNRSITPQHSNQTVPLLGYIAAGQPIEPIENQEPVVVPENIRLKPNYSYYALKVIGDSMMDMGVLDSDTVLIQHQMTADNNDVVVAITEKGATLKIFKKQNGKIVLMPKNKKYRPVYPKELEIRGKFVGLIRNNINQ